MNNNILEELRLRLIILNLESVLNIINIVNFNEFINEFSDDNIMDSYKKLINIDFKNKISLKEIITDTNIDDKSLFDLEDQVSLLMANFALESDYLFHIISYLLVLEDYSINGNDLVKALDTFLDMDENYLDEFNSNLKMLEKIRKE